MMQALWFLVLFIAMPIGVILGALWSALRLGFDAGCAWWEDFPDKDDQ